MGVKGAKWKEVNTNLFINKDVQNKYKEGADLPLLRHRGVQEARGRGLQFV